MPLPDFGDTAVVEKPKANLPDFGPEPQDVPARQPLISPHTIEGLKGAYFRGPFATALEEEVTPVPPEMMGPGGLRIPAMPVPPFGEQTGKIDLNLSRKMEPLSGVATFPAFKELEYKPPTPKQKMIEDVTGGVAESMVGTLDILTSPFGISTLGIGGISVPIQKALVAYFTYKMGKEVPEIATKLGEEAGKPPEKRDDKLIAKLITDGITATGFTVAGAMSEISPLLRRTPDLTGAPETLKLGPLRLGVQPGAPPPGYEVAGAGTPTARPIVPPAIPTPLTPSEQERALLPTPGQVAPTAFQGTFGERLRMPQGALPDPRTMAGQFPAVNVQMTSPPIAPGAQLLGPNVPMAPGPMGVPVRGDMGPAVTAAQRWAGMGGPEVPGGVTATRLPLEVTPPPEPPAEGGVAIPKEPTTPVEPGEPAKVETADQKLEARKQKLLRENESIDRRLAQPDVLADAASQKSLRDQKKKNLSEIRNITVKQNKVAEKKVPTETEKPTVEPTAPPLPQREGIEQLPVELQNQFANAERLIKQGNAIDAKQVLNGIRNQASAIAGDPEITPARARLLDAINNLLDEYDSELEVKKTTQYGELPAGSQKGKLPEQILNYYLHEGPGSFQRKAGLRYLSGVPLKSILDHAKQVVQFLDKDLFYGKERNRPDKYLRDRFDLGAQERIAASIRMTDWMRKTQMTNAQRAKLNAWLDETIGPERKDLTAEEKNQVKELRGKMDEIPPEPEELRERPQAKTPEEHVENYLASEHGQRNSEVAFAKGQSVQEFITGEAEKFITQALKNDPKDPTRWFDEIGKTRPPAYIAAVMRLTGMADKMKMSDWQRKKINDYADYHLGLRPGIGKVKPRKRGTTGAIGPEGSEGIPAQQQQRIRLSNPEDVAGLSGDTFMQNLKQAGWQPTRAAFEAAKKVVTGTDRPFEQLAKHEAEARKAYDALGDMTPQNMGEKVALGYKAQYFNEIQRFLKAADEAGEIGLDAAAKKHGVQASDLTKLSEQKLPPAAPGEVPQTRPVPPAATAEGPAEPGGVKAPPVPPAISEATTKGAVAQEPVARVGYEAPIGPTVTLDLSREALVKLRSKEFVPDIERVVKAAGGNWREAIRNLARRDGFHFIIPEGMKMDAAIEKLAGMKANSMIRKQEGSVLLPGAGKGKGPAKPPVPPTTLKSLTARDPAKDFYGIAAKLRDWRARMGFTKEILPGEGTTWRKAVQRGRDLLAQNPNAADEAVTKFFETKAINEDMISVVRAKAELMFAAARKIELSRGRSAPDYKPTYDAAVEWDEASKPMQTEWQRSGAAQQGSVDLDTGSLTDISRWFKELTYNKETGKWEEFTPKQATKAEEISEGVRKARKTAQESEDAVKAEMKRLDAEEEKAEQERLRKELYGKPPSDAIRARREEAVREEKARKKKAEEETGTSPRAIRKRARELIDLGGMDFDDIRSKIADELGISIDKVTDLLMPGKAGRKITMERWRRMAELRKVEQAAKKWIEDQAIPGWQQALSKIPRLFFMFKIMGHGAVGMITHSGLNMFNPHTWFYRDAFGKVKGYWPSFWHQWRFMAQKGFHKRMMADLRLDPNYYIARRAGLANDPFHYFDDYQLYQLENIKLTKRLSKGLKSFVDMGQRGFDALKTFRQARFNQIWDAIPDERKMQIVETKAGPIHEPNVQMARVVADAVNKATGFSGANMGMFTGAANLTLFAPRLELSRWAWLIGDPAKAMKYVDKWRRGKATPSEKQFVVHQLKEKASVVGTYISLLIVNQALLSWAGSKQRINAPGLDPNWNPRRGDFMAFKTLGKEIRIISPMIGIVRLFSQMIHTLTPGRTKFERLTPRGEAEAESVWRHARGKLSPFASTVADIALSTDFSGRPIPFPWAEPVTPAQRRRGIVPYEWSEYLSQPFAPIPVEEAIKEVWLREGMTEEDSSKWLRALGAFGAGLTGARVSSDIYTPRELSGDERLRTEPLERLAPIESLRSE